MVHTVKIMGYMEKSLPNISQLSNLGISLLIYSTLPHDIGIGVTKLEIIQLKEGTLKYEGVTSLKNLKVMK